MNWEQVGTSVIDILVNSSGIETIKDTIEKAFDIIAFNIKEPFYLIQQALHPLREQARNIIFPYSSTIGFN